MPNQKSQPGSTPKFTATPKPAAKRKTAKKPVGSSRGYVQPIRWKPIIIAAVLILLSPFYYGYVLKFFTSSWRWVRDIGSSSQYRTYKSFGIRIPTRYQIHGIDVSYAQGKINWPKVRAMKEDNVHISFAFIKATEGLLTIDPYFKRNWREAPKTGIHCGAYHFFRPSKNGLWQARFFLQNVNIESGDLPPVIDIERLDGASPKEMRSQLHNFLNHVYTKTRVKPIIYTSISFYKDYLKGYYDDYPLWIAQYNRESLSVSSNTNWWFWQHSETGRVNGINHTVDFNVFKGDSLQFEHMLLK